MWTGDDADEAVIATDTGVVNLLEGQVIGASEALATFGNDTVRVYDRRFRSWIDGEERRRIDNFGGTFGASIIASDTTAQVHIHGAQIQVHWSGVLFT